MLYLHQTKTRLALKLFRGEPAISGFDWNFSAIHTSSRDFLTSMSSALHLILLSFSLDMDRSPGFGSAHTDYLALLRLGFPAAPGLYPLTLPVCTTRRTVLQKVRRRAYKALRQFVNTGFQVLFTPLPGSFSPFLHSTMRYRSLSSI